MYNIRNVLLFQTCVYRRYILLTGVGILDIQQPKVAKDVLAIATAMRKIKKSIELYIIINKMNMGCYPSTLIKFYSLILQL